MGIVISVCSFQYRIYIPNNQQMKSMIRYALVVHNAQHIDSKKRPRAKQRSRRLKSFISQA